MISTNVATIGLRSNGPSIGSTRRKIRRYGSTTWRRNSTIAFHQRAYGGRIPTAYTMLITT